MNIQITNKDKQELEKHMERATDYPYYASTSGLTAEEIILLSKLSELEINEKTEKIIIHLHK